MQYLPERLLVFFYWTFIIVITLTLDEAKIPGCNHDGETLMKQSIFFAGWAGVLKMALRAGNWSYFYKIGQIREKDLVTDLQLFVIFINIILLALIWEEC